jgi:rubrerythrin
MNKELASALKTALTNEIAGEEFYTKVAEEAKDQFTRNTFAHLAHDEIYHIEKITLFIETEKAAAIEKRIKNRNPKSGLKFFQLTEKEFKKKKESFNKVNFGNYRLAIQIEIKSFNLYKELAGKAKDKKTKDFFQFLMKEEATHKKILEEALSFMQDPADYFLEKERWHFD